MAIAFVGAADGGNNSGSSSSLTFSYTCGSGSNRCLIVGVAGDTATDDVTGVTYAGTSMTLGVKQAAVGSSNRIEYLFYLLNPTSGANNVVISASSSHYILAGAADYTGVKQSGQPDATNTHAGAAGTPISTLTSSLTTINDNSWVILLENGFTASPANGQPTAGAGLTRRAVEAAFGSWGLFDSNGVVHPAGSYSMTTNRPGTSTTIDHAMLSLQPDTGGVTQGLFQPPLLNGISTGGPFFANPLGRTMLGWRKPRLILGY